MTTHGLDPYFRSDDEPFVQRHARIRTDCTHYCYHPDLWSTLLDGFYRRLLKWALSDPSYVPQVRPPVPTVYERPRFEPVWMRPPPAWLEPRWLHSRSSVDRGAGSLSYSRSVGGSRGSGGRGGRGGRGAAIPAERKVRRSTTRERDGGIAA